MSHALVYPFCEDSPPHPSSKLVGSVQPDDERIAMFAPEEVASVQAEAEFAKEVDGGGEPRVSAILVLPRSKSII